MSGESKKPVIRSIEDGFGERCLDILKHPDGTYTLKAFRRDPEDGGRWTLVSDFSPKTFTSERDALSYATPRLPWLPGHRPDDSRKDGE